jgi:hypothetical protein
MAPETPDKIGMATEILPKAKDSPTKVEKPIENLINNNSCPKVRHEPFRASSYIQTVSCLRGL